MDTSKLIWIGNGYSKNMAEIVKICIEKTTNWKVIGVDQNQVVDGDKLLDEYICKYKVHLPCNEADFKGNVNVYASENKTNPHIEIFQDWCGSPMIHVNNRVTSDSDAYNTVLTNVIPEIAKQLYTPVPLIIY